MCAINFRNLADIGPGYCCSAPRRFSCARLATTISARTTLTRSSSGHCLSFSPATREAGEYELRYWLSCYGKPASLSCMVLHHCAFSVHHTLRSILDSFSVTHSLLLRKLAYSTCALTADCEVTRVAHWSIIDVKLPCVGSSPSRGGGGGGGDLTARQCTVRI